MKKPRCSFSEEYINSFHNSDIKFNELDRYEIRFIHNIYVEAVYRKLGTYEMDPVYNQIYFPIIDELIKKYIHPIPIVSENDKFGRYYMIYNNFSYIRSSVRKCFPENIVHRVIENYIRMLISIVKFVPIHKIHKFMENFISGFKDIQNVIFSSRLIPMKYSENVENIIKMCREIIMIPLMKQRILMHVLSKYNGPEFINFLYVMHVNIPNDEFILNICVRYLDSELLILKANRQIYNKILRHKFGHMRRKTKLEFLSRLIYKFVTNYKLIIKIIKLLNIYNKKIVLGKYPDHCGIDIFNILGYKYACNSNKISSESYDLNDRFIFHEMTIKYIEKNNLIVVNSIGVLEKAMKCVEVLMKYANSENDIVTLDRVRWMIDIIMKNILEFCKKITYLRDDSKKMLYGFIFYQIYKYNYENQHIFIYTSQNYELSLIEYILLVKSHVDHQILLDILYNSFMKFAMRKGHKIFNDIPFIIGVRKVFKFIGMWKYLKRVDIMEKFIPDECKFKNLRNNRDNKHKSILTFSKIMMDIRLFYYVVQFLMKRIHVNNTMTKDLLFSHLSELDVNINNEKTPYISSILDLINTQRRIKDRQLKRKEKKRSKLQKYKTVKNEMVKYWDDSFETKTKGKIKRRIKERQLKRKEKKRSKLQKYKTVNVEIVNDNNPVETQAGKQIKSINRRRRKRRIKNIETVNDDMDFDFHDTE
jgi:hypothetical protein